MLGCSIEMPQVIEAVAWGAAVLTEVQVGVFSSVEEVAESGRAEKIYKPKIGVSQSEKLYPD
ncbi:MAG: glycerol kinase [Porticoccus sp.]|jgi:glycerol kinase